jgi:hypothetical protein
MDCPFCGWKKEYENPHIMFGNTSCEYINNKYHIVLTLECELAIDKITHQITVIKF